MTVTCTIPLQLALLGATGALICVLAGMTAAMVFTEDDASSSGDDAAADGIEAVGTLNAVLGIALMVFAAVRFGYELWEMQKRHHEREKGGRVGDRRHRWRWAAEEENEASDLPIDDGLPIVLPIADDAAGAKEGMGGSEEATSAGAKDFPNHDDTDNTDDRDASEGEAGMPAYASSSDSSVGAPLQHLGRGARPSTPASPTPTIHSPSNSRYGHLPEAYRRMLEEADAMCGAARSGREASRKSLD